ncbi:hypothetical protein [Amycolatopsis alba]|uniref:hypothetical protein n=1 Tax=Amycolatopsis alba TaxID=76020 RepID=UPI00039CFCD2|nr:hypothetical protein [Amycolatopsis alba]
MASRTAVPASRRRPVRGLPPSTVDEVGESRGDLAGLHDRARPGLGHTLLDLARIIDADMAPDRRP